MCELKKYLYRSEKNFMLAGDGGGPIKVEISAKTRVCFALLTKVEEFGPSDRKTQKEKERMFLDFLLLRKTFRTVTQKAPGASLSQVLDFNSSFSLNQAAGRLLASGKAECTGRVQEAPANHGPAADLILRIKWQEKSGSGAQGFCTTASGGQGRS